MRLQIIALPLGIFMMTSFALCFVMGLAMPQQMECLHTGNSTCTMHDEDCCLTESNKARVRTAEGLPISSSRGSDLHLLQLIDEDFL